VALTLTIALAVLQGLTEFLPVSSSGHLRLLSAFFGVEEPQTFFDVALHVGTLIPILLIYRSSVGKILVELLAVTRRSASLETSPYARLGLFVVVASVPTGLIGVFVGPLMEALAADLLWVGVALAANGVLLLFLGRLSRRIDAGGEARSIEALTARDALVIGVIQGCAVFRGISRSGSTITAGLLTGLDREAAATFSFLISIPAITGALVLKLAEGGLSGVDGLSLVVGVLVSAIVGWVALKWLLRLLHGGGLTHFAWYCFVVSGVTILWRLELL
jgi:undecaprenyl-diphosphatase